MSTEKTSSVGERCRDALALLFQSKSQARHVSSNGGKAKLFIAAHISISEGLEDETIHDFLSFSAFFKEDGRL